MMRRLFGGWRDTLWPLIVFFALLYVMLMFSAYCTAPTVAVVRRTQAVGGVNRYEVGGGGRYETVQQAHDAGMRLALHLFAVYAIGWGLAAAWAVQFVRQVYLALATAAGNWMEDRFA